MNASFKAPMALGFILAIPLFALPALGAPRTKQDAETGASSRRRISPTRQAYVSPDRARRAGAGNRRPQPQG